MNQSERAIEQVITKLTQHFGGVSFSEELIIAQTEFFGGPQISDEKNHQFELKLAQFFDWYIFSRDLSQYRQTPIEVCLLQRELRFSDEEQLLISKLKLHKHSLFSFSKVKGEDIHLVDLLKNEKIVVRKSPWIFGFESDQLFEARLIPYDTEWIFTKGLCFHPPESKEYILSEVKKHRKDLDLNPEDLMLRLLKMRFRFEKYKHVKPEMIYTN
jgi:hypothetical protein